MTTHNDWRNVDATTPVDLAAIRCRVAGHNVATLGEVLDRAGIRLDRLEVRFEFEDGDGDWVTLATLNYGELAGAARDTGTTT
jgi:hypothetical protein